MKKDKGEIVVPFVISETEVKAFGKVALPDGVEAKAIGIDPELEVFEFKGYASTFGNVDRGADVVDQGAFTDFIAGQKASGDILPALWQHQWESPVGIYIELREDAKGLFVHGVMPLDDDFVKKRVIPQMRIKSVSKMSIGYFINDSEWDGDIRHLKKLGLWEISIVTVPMNNEANITEMKRDGLSLSTDELKTMTERELENGLRSGLPLSKEASKVVIALLKRWDAEGSNDDAGRDALKTLSAFAETHCESTHSICETLKRLEQGNE